MLGILEILDVLELQQHHPTCLRLLSVMPSIMVWETPLKATKWWKWNRVN